MEDMMNAPDVGVAGVVDDIEIHRCGTDVCVAGVMVLDDI